MDAPTAQIAKFSKATTTFPLLTLTFFPPGITRATKLHRRKSSEVRELHVSGVAKLVLGNGKYLLMLELKETVAPIAAIKRFSLDSMI